MRTYCKWCGKPFSVSDYEIARGNGKFCSKTCSARNAVSKKGGRKILPCAYCGIEISVKLSRVKRSKSGQIFCCLSHRNKLQKSKTRNRRNPKYPNYRKIAFEFYEHKCADCGYNAHEEILEVHHIDRNRSNNSLENLVILCPNCHSLRHKNNLKKML